MTHTRFTCSLTRADEPGCQSYARVTIVDSEDDSARGCPRHAVAALDGIAGAHIDQTDSKGLNEWERKALELTGERSELGLGQGVSGHVQGQKAMPADEARAYGQQASLCHQRAISHGIER